MENTHDKRCDAVVPENRLLRGALSLARRGFPVLPCKAEDKSPYFRRGLMENGYKSASADPAVVSRFWDTWPEAMIGVPTGRISGRFVLDLDVREGCNGLEAFAELESEYGALPDTLTFGTAGGGEHRYFSHPGFDVRNRTGSDALALGVEVKGNGGYVIVPPSPGYTVLRRYEVAKAPRWLLDSMRNATAKGSKEIRTTEVSLQTFESIESLSTGDTISRGSRNSTLFSLAMSARRRGAGEEKLQEIVDESNHRRCSPPLPDREVRKIISSALSTRLIRRPVSQSTRDILGRASAELDMRRWLGMSGKTDRSVFRAIIAKAYEVGTEIAAGVRVSISVRDLALIAGVGANTISKSTMRLEKEGFLRRDKFERGAREAGAWILPRSLPSSGGSDVGAQDRHTRSVTAEINRTGCKSVSELRVSELRAPDEKSSNEPSYLRWGCGALGKSKEEILHVIAESRPGLAAEDIALRIGISRVRDLKRRHLDSLLEMGVVVLSEEDAIYSLAPDCHERLKEIRRENGELTTSHRAANRFERERQAYHEQLLGSSVQRRRGKRR